MKMRASVVRKKIHVDSLIYALYEGEKLITTGTIYDISDEVKTSIDTLYFYLTEGYRNRLKKRKYRGAAARIMVCLGYDDTEEADQRFLDASFRRKEKKKQWSYVTI